MPDLMPDLSFWERLCDAEVEVTISVNGASTGISHRICGLTANHKGHHMVAIDNQLFRWASTVTNGKGSHGTR